MKVEAVAPEEFLGDIIGGLNGRRATIRGMEMRLGNAQAINATVPLGEMFGYATELRSATQGRGVFSMEFDHYAPVPESVAHEILKTHNSFSSIRRENSWRSRSLSGPSRT